MGLEILGLPVKEEGLLVVAASVEKASARSWLFQVASMSLMVDRYIQASGTAATEAESAKTCQDPLRTRVHHPRF